MLGGNGTESNEGLYAGVSVGGDWVDAGYGQGHAVYLPFDIASNSGDVFVKCSFSSFVTANEGNAFDCYGQGGKGRGEFSKSFDDRAGVLDPLREVFDGWLGSFCWGSWFVGGCGL